MEVKGAARSLCLLVIVTPVEDIALFEMLHRTAHVACADICYLSLHDDSILAPFFFGRIITC